MMFTDPKAVAVSWLMLTGIGTLAGFSSTIGSPAWADSSVRSEPAPNVTDPCGALAELAIDQTEIVSAKTQAAGAPISGATLSVPGMAAGSEISGLPGFCRVVGRIHAEPGSDIGFEVWMPGDGWTGRMIGIGVGGFAGTISYRELSLVIRTGQVGMTTDTGHKGSYLDGDWAKDHPERVRDYGWRAFHLTTLAAKRLVAAYYGHAPKHSYFVGCSGGGRQGLIEASRFPKDYDGILAGAPAANFTDIAMSQIWIMQAQLAPGAQIRPDQTHFLQNEVLKQCDALDGRVDGIVEDPRQCKLDTSRLACATSSSPQCFTPPQITALNRIYAGPRNASGQLVGPAYLPSGSEVGDERYRLGWDSFIFGTAERPPTNGIFPHNLLQNFVAEPFADVQNFDFATDPARLKAALASDIDASPDLHRYFAHGGKLLLWHGWADGVVPPSATLTYYHAVLHSSRRASTSSRLFMVAGVQHCGGGPGPGMFGQDGAPPSGETPDQNMVAALQAWVETGRDPDSIVGQKTSLAAMTGGAPAGTEMQQLLCAYPARAVPRAGANPGQAASYVCVLPNKGK